MSLHHGSCHCQRVRFEVHGAITGVTECNCSICRRVGALWYGTTDQHVHIVSGEDQLALHQFGTRTAKHYFCRHCGIHPLTRPRIDPALWVVNVRCIDGIDLAALKRRPFDGQNWEEAAKALRAKPSP